MYQIHLPLLFYGYGWFYNSVMSIYVVYYRYMRGTSFDQHIH